MLGHVRLPIRAMTEPMASSSSHSDGFESGLIHLSLHCARSSSGPAIQTEMEAEVSLTNHGKSSLAFLIYPQLGHEIENEKRKKGFSSMWGEEKSRNRRSPPPKWTPIAKFCFIVFQC